jgi:MoaA/NifB/PqqE/SkfB family radical SAM enzyme
MRVQISLSTVCGAKCRFCLGTTLERLYGFRENIHMDMDVFKKLMSYDIEEVVICSNRGEALYHPDIDEILKHIKDKGCQISFLTNASLKPEKWWKELASIFDIKDKIIFPLDGLGNEMHKQHRGTDFYTVLRNMEAFVNAGGKATWSFIRFKHNEHVQEFVKQLALRLKMSVQFRNSHTYDDVLERPVSIKVWERSNIHNESIEVEDQRQMHCNFGLYYVSVKGYVFPCCFLANVFANEPYLEDYAKEHDKRLVRLFRMEKEFLNLKNTDLHEILEKSKFFKECLKMKSFTCKDSCLKFFRNNK